MIDKDKEEIIKKNIAGDRNHYQLQIYRLCMSLHKYIFNDPTCNTWCRRCQKCCKFLEKSRVIFRLLSLELKVTSNFVLVKWDAMKLFSLHELFCSLDGGNPGLYDTCMHSLCKMANKFRMKPIISTVCDLHAVNIYFIKFI